MPSKQPRKPEVQISESGESGFVANIYDGEYLVQVRPHENGYQVNLASKTGLGDAAFLRTYSRAERFRELLENEFDAIDTDAVFEVLDGHFSDEEYRIVNVKEGIKQGTRRGVILSVETGETLPRLTDERDYRDDQWTTDTIYRVTVWPDNNQYTEIRDLDKGEQVEHYFPNSHREDIRNEEKDDHERERGPTSVPGVHAPVTSSKLENAPVVHTDVHCSHLKQLDRTRFNPAGEEPPSVPTEEFGELPLRWCLSCAYRIPTPEEIRERYGP